MIGKTLAHYEITELLGKGGMGEVYRAQDTKLGRQIALKILPREMSGDPERIARFDREARTLASLQHPNVASIYGFEESEGVRFLVMELVEGRDLSERLADGPLDVDEAIEIARQMAQGLEAAHDKGVVHRDLKPANIKLMADGTVKILDFGLARAYAGDVGEESDLANSPTITAAMTQAGTILGTAAYMSPEQARGKYVDQRSDLWSFGVIFLEMLTGQKLFEGETVSDTLAAVLRAEPDWSELPDETPAGARRVLRRCLVRDPRQRMRSAGDIWLELGDTAVETRVEDIVPGRSRLLPLAMIALAAAFALAVWLMRPSPEVEEDRDPRYLSLTLPEGTQFVSRDRLPLGAPQPCVDISPDGRLIVCVVESEGTTRLYRRFLDSPSGDFVPGTEGAYHPKISPDGRRISFLTDDFLKRVDADGERVTNMAEVTNPFGQCWLSPEEVLVAIREANDMMRVDVQRGTTTIIPGNEEWSRFQWPHPVSGVDAVLVNQSSVAKSDEREADPIYLQWLDGERRELLGVQGSIPSIAFDRHLLFVRDGALLTAPFDLDNLSLDVRPRTILDGLLVEANVGQYAISQEGTLVYVPGEWLAGKHLVWADGEGNVEELNFPSLGYGDFELSPDGSKVAITVGSNNSTIWVYDIERGTRRLLTTEGPGYNPTWSPDGLRIAYTGRDDDQRSLRVRTVGSAEAPEVLITAGRLSPYAWHETGGLLFGIGMGIARFDPDDPDNPELLVDSPASEWGPDISPDGRWMAYTSDESGRYEIYARSLVGGSRSWPVSVEGGEEPIWSADGTAIYFRYGSRFFRTPVIEASEDGQRFRAGQPVVYVEGAYSNVPGLSYDVGSDGRLLVLRSDGGTERATHLNVVLDWDELLERD